MFKGTAFAPRVNNHPAMVENKTKKNTTPAAPVKAPGGGAKKRVPRTMR